jgi:hypothetical protein
VGSGGASKGGEGRGGRHWGGRSATKPIPSMKPVGDVVGSSTISAPSPLSLSPSSPIQCLLGGEIEDGLQLGGEPRS